MELKKPLSSQGLTEEEFLSRYDPGKYERPSVTVDMLVFTVTDVEADSYRKLPGKALKLLMIKRGDHPHIGKWALPGGFVKMDESLEHAAARELEEETGIGRIYLEQLYTWGEPGRDPRTRVISTSYLSLADSSGLNTRADDDANDAAWFAVSLKTFEERKQTLDDGFVHEKFMKLTLDKDGEVISAVLKKTLTFTGGVSRSETALEESGGIAFDHAKIVAYGIERLRNKVEYTDIAFNLMPRYFTLTELQQVYEIILDTELLKANFRRKISGKVLETGKYTSEAGHRPSKLFTYNPAGLLSV